MGFAHQKFEKRVFVELIVNALTNDFFYYPMSIR